MATSQSISDSGTVEYREIPSLPGFRVGSDGSIWSCWKLEGQGNRLGWKAVMSHTAWRKLKPTPNRFGYLRVRFSIQNKSRQPYIHLLVLEAFAGPRPLGMVACHNDGDRTNNVPSNLRWDTHEANQQDKRTHGTLACGSKVGTSRLTEAQVREIIEQLQNRVGFRELGRRYKVGHFSISAIAHGKTWKHITRATHV